MLSLEIVRDVVTEVTLVGPGKGNAMGPDLWRELPQAFAELDADAGVRAIVVRGKGGNFTYGLDLAAMGAELAPLVAGSPGPAERTKLLAMIHELQRAITSVATCRKPVIAAIAGWCIGGGVDLATACDVRLASADARFSVREVKVAMVADLGTLQRLPAIVGDGVARELALTGKDVDADRARRIGLVNDVLADEAQLLEAARAMAREIADNPPLVVEGIKRVMNEEREARAAAGLRHVAVWNAAFLPSEDLAEALGAFMAKRKPVFKGR